MAQLQSQYLPDLLRAYPGVSAALAGSSRDEMLGVRDFLLAFVAACFGIYALMAIPLRSYLQPLVIMSVIPFGIVGAVIGHWVMGMAVSSLSLFGIIALAGVVVNDSLILVDYVNKRVDAGMDAAAAAIAGGSARFRAILLTSLTTFLGLAPITLLETSLQAQLLIPMAASLAFGIVFATIITLILIPSLYLLLDDAKKGLTKLRGFLLPGLAQPPRHPHPSALRMRRERD